MGQFRPGQDYLKLDGIPYHRVDTSNIPPGYLEVDVLVDDNGTEFDTLMVAGQIGMRVSSSGDKGLSAGGLQDTVAPVAGWWIFTKRPGGGSSEDQLLEDLMANSEELGDDNEGQEEGDLVAQTNK